MVKRSKRVTSREKNCAASQGSKLHDNEQQRLIFEQASSSILTFDFSAALPALELFLPSSDSFWTSGMYPGLFARRISASDIFFYFFLYFFFFWKGKVSLPIHFEVACIGIRGGMSAMRATGTCRETHTGRRGVIERKKFRKN